MDNTGNGDSLRRTASEVGANTQPPGGGASDGVPSDTTEDDWSRGSGEDPDLEIIEQSPVADRNMSDLDRKVNFLIIHFSDFYHF